LRKRIQKLTGETPTQLNSKTYAKPIENGMIEPGQEFVRTNKSQPVQRVIEDNIKKEIKNKIKQKKKMKLRSEEEVDILLKSFEERINKKLKKLEEAGEDIHQKRVKRHDEDQEFDQVEIDEL